MRSETPKDYGEKLAYDPEFQGPVKSRSCTDIFFLLLFIVFLAGWGVIAFFAFHEGDPKALLYPTDSDGNICGHGKLQDKQYLFFFDLLKCTNPSVVISGCPTPQVCVEKCPSETFYARPSDSERIKEKLICKYNVSKKNIDLGKLLNDGLCAKLYLKSTPVFGRCIPDLFFKSGHGEYVKDERNQTVRHNSNEVTVEAVKNATETLAKFLSLTEFGEKVFSDFKTSWKFLLAGLIVSMIISLIWIILMRWIAVVMVWLSIIAILVFSAYGCYRSSVQYVELRDSPNAQKFHASLNLGSYLQMKRTWLILAIICASIFVILFFTIVFLRKRIAIAIELIGEASKAVAKMSSTLFFPLFPYILMVIFFAFWVTVSLYIASSGKPSFVIADAPPDGNEKNGALCTPGKYNSTGSGIKCMFKTYSVKENRLFTQLFNLFGLLWGLFFVVGIGQVSLSGAFASYYWTQDKEKNIPSFAAGSGLYRCVRYHLGSVAFGSLLIAFIRFIRIMLEWVDQQCKKYDNKLTKAIMCIMKCCFFCLENLLKFISKNAYIMIAIYGKNFCTSSRHAFKLLMRNVVRVVVLDKITDFLLLLGKLVVVTLSAGVSYYFFATDQKLFKGIPPLNYNLLPPIVIAIGSYLIASGFFSVYGMAVDTLFLCFLEDCERNDGTPEKRYYMPKGLMKILNKQNKFKEPSSPH